MKNKLVVLCVLILYAEFYVKINKLFNRKGIGGQICAFSAFETSPHPSSHARNFFEKSQSVSLC